MKSTKIAGLILSCVFFLSVNLSAANVTPNKGEPATFTKQIQNHLSDLDLSYLSEDVTVLVNFMISPQNELIILETNNEGMDQTIKNQLNYTTVQGTELAPGEVYTMPLTFSKG